MDIQIIPQDPAFEALSLEALWRLNEVAPCLIRKLASSSGMSIGDLRKMAAEGQLTSAVLLGASGE